MYTLQERNTTKQSASAVHQHRSSDTASPQYASSSMAAQRKLADMIAASPRQSRQLKLVERIQGASQRKFSAEATAQREQQAPNRTGLPDRLKSGIENLSGMSMDHVKVHYNSGKPVQMNALAYAQGSHIHVAPGQEKHLPHEAWHVVQQAQGRVRPTMQMENGASVNDDRRLEHEADVMGARSLAQFKRQPAMADVPSSPMQARQGPVQLAGQVIQRNRFIGNPASYHMHIDIAQPHYKMGNNVGTRIDIGPDHAYRVHDLQEVIDLLRGNHNPDAIACYNWCLRQASAIRRAASTKAGRRANRRGW